MVQPNITKIYDTAGTLVEVKTTSIHDANGVYVDTKREFVDDRLFDLALWKPLPLAEFATELAGLAHLYAAHMDENFSQQVELIYQHHPEREGVSRTLFCAQVMLPGTEDAQYENRGPSMQPYLMLLRTEYDVDKGNGVMVCKEHVIAFERSDVELMG